MGESRELTVVEERSVTEVKNQVNKIQSLMRDLMTEGEHFGPSFPGDTKKNLLKPGADKLCFTFRLSPEYEVKREDLAGGHREYEVKTTLRNMATGKIVAQGLGSCSTMESKYRWRYAAKKCPMCGKEAIIKGKEEYGGGWICFKKKDGCGASFKDDDPQIISQAAGKIENPDIADTYNTVLKMAKKRSYVDATITACAASDIFTQDAEDMAPESASSRHAEDQTVSATASTTSKSRTTQPSGPVSFQDYIKLINETVPSKDRQVWMQKAKGGKDPALLGQLAAEIRTTYPNNTSGPATEKDLRIEIMEFINTIVPEPDRKPLRHELEKIEDNDLRSALDELKARYAA